MPEPTGASRNHYASVFYDYALPIIRDNNEGGERNLIGTSDSKHPVIAFLGPRSEPVTEDGSDNNATQSGGFFHMSVTFPSHKTLPLCSWMRLKPSDTVDTNMIYLNPKLLDCYERACSVQDRSRLLAIMHFVVTHELAHLLHFKVYKTVDCVVSQEGRPHEGIDYGTEVKHRIFGGRMLTTTDFSELRIERKNGDIYEMSDYFFKEMLNPYNRKVDFDRLSKVDPKLDVDEKLWMRMSEINESH